MDSASAGHRIMQAAGLRFRGFGLPLSLVSEAFEGCRIWDYPVASAIYRRLSTRLRAQVSQTFGFRIWGHWEFGAGVGLIVQSVLVLGFLSHGFNNLGAIV